MEGADPVQEAVASVEPEPSRRRRDTLGAAAGASPVAGEAALNGTSSLENGSVGSGSSGEAAKGNGLPDAAPLSSGAAGGDRETKAKGGEYGPSELTSWQAIGRICCCDCTPPTWQSSFRGRWGGCAWACIGLCLALAAAVVAVGVIYGRMLLRYDTSPYVCPAGVIGLEPGVPATAPYELFKEYSGADFLDGWYFFTADDPTEGKVPPCHRRRANAGDLHRPPPEICTTLPPPCS